MRERNNRNFYINCFPSAWVSFPPPSPNREYKNPDKLKKINTFKDNLKNRVAEEN
jgi:hypothetical protein